mgnify:CR=1 FL=1
MSNSDRQRLQRQLTEKIGKRFEDLGYVVKIRGYQAVHIYKKVGDELEWAAAFYWVTKKGWRLDLAQPFCYTNYDLDTAVEDFKATQEAIAAADAAWNEYNNKRNEANWRKYQGAMAAHQTRAFGSSWIKGSGF